MLPSDNALQVFYGTLPVVGAILLANWNNNKRLDDLNKRLDDLKTSLNKRLDDLAAQMNTGFSEVKTALGKLDTRVSELEK
jgi:tetrahydromethanopterin S-methyltransferase subunit G